MSSTDHDRVNPAGVTTLEMLRIPIRLAPPAAPPAPS
jgi:hypothetical protein